MSDIVSRLARHPRRAAGRRWTLGLGVALFCAAYVAGRNSGSFAEREISARQVLYYVDQMHPAYRSEKPGKTPDCGMDLEPVYAGGIAPSCSIPKAA